MKVSFVSNLFNHHQKPFSDAMNKKTDNNYSFIATMAMTDELKNLGYQSFYDEEYIVNAFENEEQRKTADNKIENADVVIYGSAPLSIIQKRLASGGVVFQYSERVYRLPSKWYEIPFRAIKYWWLKGRFKNMYLLCSSAFTAADYHKTRTFENRAYKWGYFPETRDYAIDELVKKKHKNNILWMGRFLELKHPQDVLKVAKKLKEDGYTFSIKIGGTGEKEEELRSMTEALKLNDFVSFLGAIPSDKVRGYMEKAGIYLFTSDRNEGWGAVLNEAMNSGCAVVASHAIGSVPYLVKNNENGLIYKSGNVDELYEKVKYLLDNPQEQERLGKAAYETIVGEWNAEVAADRLIKLSECILAGNTNPILFQSGPCSKAEVIKDEWFNG